MTYSIEQESWVHTGVINKWTNNRGGKKKLLLRAEGQLHKQRRWIRKPPSGNHQISPLIKQIIHRMLKPASKFDENNSISIVSKIYPLMFTTKGPTVTFRQRNLVDIIFRYSSDHQQEWDNPPQHLPTGCTEDDSASPPGSEQMSPHLVLLPLRLLQVSRHKGRQGLCCPGWCWGLEVPFLGNKGYKSDPW